jgi:GT2 family glycosyltransferase
MGRNLWASIASGEYFVFLDADVTIFHPDEFFAEALRILEITPNSVALTGPMRVLPEMETWADRIIFWALGYLFMFMNNVLHTGWASGEFQMVRQDAFKKVGGFDEELIGWEDKNHFEKLAKIGRTLSARRLTVYHTGRRAHKIGWPKLLLTWGIAILPSRIQKKVLKEWTVIR